MFEKILSQPKFLRQIEIIAKNLTKGTSVSWEDAFQLAIVKVLHAIESKKFPTKIENFYNWSAKVAKNAIRDMMRKERRRSYETLDKTFAENGLSHLESIPDELNLFYDLEHQDFTQKVIETIRILDELYPKQGYLKLSQGLAESKTQQQIATELRISQGEVSKRKKQIARLIFNELGLLPTS